MVADVALDARPLMAVAKDPSTGKLEEDAGETDHATVLLYRVAPDSLSGRHEGRHGGGHLVLLGGVHPSRLPACRLGRIGKIVQVLPAMMRLSIP